MASTKQCADVDKRVEFTALSNSYQQTYKGVVINVHSAIRLAFVLGARFDMAQPTLAGDYMHRWLHDHRIETTAEELGEKHERAMYAITYPLTFTAEEYGHQDDYPNDDSDSDQETLP